VLIVISTFLVLGIAGFISYIIYYASQGTRILIQNMDYKLKARMYGESDRQKPKPAILFLSGWNPGKMPWTTSDFYAGFLSKRMNLICFTVALRGMGSEGNINILNRSDFLDDVIAAYDFLSNLEGVNKDQINIVGESFGAYMACVLSSKRSVFSLVLRVPTDFPDKGFNDTSQIKFVGVLSKEWKMVEHHFTESYPLNAIHEFNGNILIVASEFDKFIPLQTIKNYLSAIPDKSKVEFHLFKSTSHAMLNPWKQWTYIQILYKWLNRNIN
jgi:uncharacterized protein